MTGLWEHGAAIVGAKAVCMPPLAVFLFLYSLFHPKLSLHECFWSSFPIGYVLSSWLSYVTACLFGSASATAMRVSFALWTPIAAYAVLLAARKLREQGGRAAVRRMLAELRKETWLHVLILISSLYFGYVFHIHSLYRDADDNLWSGGSIWSDLGFHLNVINGFLHGRNREMSLATRPESLIFSGHPLSYPFIPDFHTVSWVAAGAFDTRWALLIPSVLIIVALMALLFSFVRRFLLIDVTQTRQRADCIAFFSVLLWLMSGGIGGWSLVRNKGLRWSWDDLVNSDWMQFTTDKTELYWFSCPSHVLLPQRSALFAYPLAVLVFICVYAGVNDATLSNPQRRNSFVLAGVLTGLIPLVHAHSFVAIGVIVAAYALLHPLRTFTIFPGASGGRASPSWQQLLLGYGGDGGQKAESEDGKAEAPYTGTLFWSWWHYGLPIILLSLPQLPIYLDRLLNSGSDVSFITVSPIWRNWPWRKYFTYHVDLNFFSMWFGALGFFVPLAVIGCVFFSRRQLRWLLCFWLLFAVANFVQFQPWDKDNNKLFLVWAMLASASVVVVLQKMWCFTLGSPVREEIVTVTPDIYSHIQWQPKTANDDEETPYGARQAPVRKKRRVRVRQGCFPVRVLVVILALSLALSGALIMYREANLWWQFMDLEDQEFAAWVVANTETDAVFVTNDSHIHPVTNMAGRASLFSFAGWVQSHGYPDMWVRHGDIKRMLADGSASAHLWPRYGAHYLVYDWRLTYDFTVNKAFFDSHPLVKLVYDTEKYKVYDVRDLA